MRLWPALSICIRTRRREPHTGCSWSSGRRSKVSGSGGRGSVLQCEAHEVVCGDVVGRPFCRDASASGRGCLGHGLGAAPHPRSHSNLRSNPHHVPARIFEAAPAALRSTRGAVLGVPNRPDQKLFRYAGRDVSGVIVSDGIATSRVENGTFGTTFAKFRNSRTRFPRMRSSCFIRTD